MLHDHPTRSINQKHAYSWSTAYSKYFRRNNIQDMRKVCRVHGNEEIAVRFSQGVIRQDDEKLVWFEYASILTWYIKDSARYL